MRLRCIISTSMTRGLSHMLIGLLLPVLSVACSSEQKSEEDAAHPDILIQVGDSVLTRDMIAAQIPSGLPAGDSLRMFDALVENWVERNLLVTLAGSRLPDIEKIDRMVEQYREQLLANEYRRMMAHDNEHGVSRQSITEYYEEHPEQFTLKQPLVKGIYLKVSKDAPQLSELRAWVHSGQSDDIDNLEKYGLSNAMEYDYFGDTWIDWQTVADHIPYRFSDADKFVRQTEFFEWEDRGTVYMLRILSYLGSGQRMPQEYAEDDIRERLLDQQRGSYDRELLRSLYTSGLQEKKVIPGSYVPSKYR